MKTHFVKLIGYPDFYQEKNHETILSFNDIFWEFIFDFERSSKYLNTKKLSREDVDNLVYIRKHLKDAYTIFLLIRNQQVGVDLVLFAFNVIQSYFNIFNKDQSFGMTFKFFNFFTIHKDSKDTQAQFFSAFFSTEGSSFLENIGDGDEIVFFMKFSEQLMQAQIIVDLIRTKLKKNLRISFNISGVIEFENKKAFKKQIILLFGEDTKIDTGFVNRTPIQKTLFGKKYRGYTFFNNGCSWRVCTFCNIGKDSNYFLKKQDRERDITQLIEKIGHDGVDMVNINDPSITLEELRFLSQKIIDLGLQVRFHLRTRFTHEYTQEDFILFSQAGFAFMGIGLETTSNRLNGLMKKYDREYTKSDFVDLIGLGAKYGVHIHYYTIFGFPTETQDEIKDLGDFLIDTMKKVPFFSFTAGGFGLSKGTYMYDNYKDFGISFSESGNLGEVFLSDYREKNLQENGILIKYIREKLISYLFFKHISHHIQIISFWYFIEESTLFHIIKMSHDINPFHQYFSQNQDIDRNDFIKSRYKKNPFVQIVKKGNRYFLKNWITLIEASVLESILPFFLSYNSNISLQENIIVHDVDSHKEQIFYLCELYFFIKLKE